MNLNAKKLILGLLVAADDRALLASEVVAACELFGISENSARVALSRLSGEGKIESVSRGVYRLAAGTERFTREIRSWRDSERRLVQWNGDFLAAHTGPLGRSDRTGIRRRERALDMMGFREWQKGLHVRPANIEGSASNIANRLYSLGLDEDAAVFIARDLEATTSKDSLRRLWDTEGLESRYAEEAEQLESWLERYESLALPDAARESYVLGNQAIRSLVFDPWLPEEFIDTEQRHRFFETVCSFDDVGQRIWDRLVVNVVDAEDPARRATHSNVN
jgi:phenylacetic acid degradation operon negative regulatory protein